MTKAAKRASGSKAKPRYKRVLFKVSGEALMGSQSFGIDPKMTARIARDVKQAVGLGVRVALVVGGGNIFRGVALAAGGADRVTGDHEPLLITREGGKPSAVMISLEDFASYEETHHLLKSPENARRLAESIEALSKGRGRARELAE